MIIRHMRDRRPRSWNPKDLYPRHQEMLRLLATGMRPKDVATHLGCTRQNVSDVANSPLGQARLNELQSGRDASAINISRQINAICPSAVETLKKVIEGDIVGSAADQIRASLGVLDRAGYGPISKVSMQHQHTLSQEDIEELKSRARSAGVLAVSRTVTDSIMAADFREGVG